MAGHWGGSNQLRDVKMLFIKIYFATMTTTPYYHALDTEKRPHVIEKNVKSLTGNVQLLVISRKFEISIFFKLKCQVFP